MIVFKLKDNVVSQVVVDDDAFNLPEDTVCSKDSDDDTVLTDTHFPLNATSAKLLYPYAMAEVARLEMLNQESIVLSWNYIKTRNDPSVMRYPDRSRHIELGYIHALAILAFIEAFTVPELGLPQDVDLSAHHIRALSKLVSVKVIKMTQDY